MNNIFRGMGGIIQRLQTKLVQGKVPLTEKSAKTRVSMSNNVLFNFRKV